MSPVPPPPSPRFTKPSNNHVPTACATIGAGSGDASSSRLLAEIRSDSLETGTQTSVIMHSRSG